MEDDTLIELEAIGLDISDASDDASTTLTLTIVITIHDQLRMLALIARLIAAGLRRHKAGATVDAARRAGGIRHDA